MPDQPQTISADPADQVKIPGDGPGAEYVSSKGISWVMALLVALAIALVASLYFAWPDCDSMCSGEKNEARSASQRTTAAQAGTPPLTTDLTPRTTDLASQTTDLTPQSTTAPAGAAAPGAQANVQQPGVGSTTASQVAQPTAPPKPVEVTSIRPLAGPAGGGTRVTIQGSGFAAGAEVTFDGLLAKDVSVSSGGTVLHATTPCHTNGKADVTVTNPDRGTDSLPAAFDYSCACGSERKILLLVILAGALGGVLYSLRSLVWFVGNRKLIRSWIPLYFFVPLTSALVACVFYLVIRAGFFDPKESTSCLGVVGLAVLVGLFSEEAVEKLKMIATAILTGKPPAADPAPPTPPQPPGPPDGTEPQLKVDPPDGPIGEEKIVRILGKGFSAATPPTVTFGGQPAPDVTVIDSSTLSVLLPKATAAGTVEVVVTPPGGTPLRNAKGFTYR